MKRKYLFVHCSGCLHADVPFVTVWIGESRRDSQVLRFFQNLAHHSSFFFKKWSTEVDEFRTKCVGSFYPGLHDVSLLRSIVADGRNLMRVLLAAYPRPHRTTSMARDIAKALSARGACQRPLPSRKEENLHAAGQQPTGLSDDELSLWSAIAGFCFIGVVVLLDYFVSLAGVFLGLK